jgi:hypothetical protein
MAERRNTDLFEVLIGDSHRFRGGLFTVAGRGIAAERGLERGLRRSIRHESPAERARAEAAVPQEIWDQCIAKMASD